MPTHSPVLRFRGAVAAGVSVLVAALAVFLAPAASADELLSGPVTASGQTSRSCTDELLDGEGIYTERFTSPALGALTATLAGGGGDWDLAVFSAKDGSLVAGSAYSGSDEVAGGYAFEGEKLIVQACALEGAAGKPDLDVSLEPAERERPGPAPALLRVSVADADDEVALENSGLDVTESAGPGYVEVVAYGAADRRTLARLGLSYVTRIKDLSAQSARQRIAEQRAADDPATLRAEPGLPSGRTGTYRRLFDYSAEMKKLAARNPKLVKLITLPFETYEGRRVQGMIISKNVRKSRGKPTFMQLGVHHAREWPSSEHAMEWAYELLKGFKSGDKRATRLVKKSRTFVVPIVNPDGFNASREAGQLQGAAGGRGGAVEEVNIVSHPNEYRRKNCRFPTGRGGSCAQPAFGLASGGVDPNRNYGGFWGGPGASTMPTAEDYRGPGPFSEPETRNIRSLVSRNQVTAFITNHTFTGLVLRPPGIASQGEPFDEGILAKLGAKMAAENGYVNQPSYALYDTTGSTEDWAYYATGALGYTFEIGPRNFHPPYDEMIDEWTGDTQLAGDGDGNRAAYYHLANFTLKKVSHATIKGTAPKGGRVVIKKEFFTKTSPVIDDSGNEGTVRKFRDRLRSSVRVRDNGRFKFAINPSTRPIVAKSTGREPTGPPSPPKSFEGGPAGTTPCASAETEDPGCWNDHAFTVPAGSKFDNDSATVRIEWTTPTTDWDIAVYEDSDGDGSSAGEKNPVGTSANGPSTSEQVTIADLKPGRKYVIRVVNFTALEPYAGTITFDGPEAGTAARTERWTLICRKRSGRKTGTRKLYIERGKTKKLDLRKGC